MALTRTIAFLNQKGGVGKTTTTVNLAAAIADAGRSVGVIDLDPQAHLTLHFGVEPAEGEASVYDVLTDPGTTFDEAIRPLSDHLWLLPAETDLAAAEVELAAAGDRTERLRRKYRVSKAAETTEFLLIDCPPSLGLLTLNALALAREVVVPMQAHFLALQGVSKLLQTVGLVCRQVNPDLRVSGVVLCMHETQTKLATEVVEDLEKFFASQREVDVPWRYCRVLKPAIRRNIKLAEAPSFGTSIFGYDAACAGAEDYRRLADGLIREWDALAARRGEGAAAVTVRPTAATDAVTP